MKHSFLVKCLSVLLVLSLLLSGCTQAAAPSTEEIPEKTAASFKEEVVEAVQEAAAEEAVSSEASQQEEVSEEVSDEVSEGTSEETSAAPYNCKY